LDYHYIFTASGGSERKTERGSSFTLTVTVVDMNESIIKH